MFICFVFLGVTLSALLFVFCLNSGAAWLQMATWNTFWQKAILVEAARECPNTCLSVGFAPRLYVFVRCEHLPLVSRKRFSFLLLFSILFATSRFLGSLGLASSVCVFFRLVCSVVKVSTVEVVVVSVCSV